MKLIYFISNFVPVLIALAFIWHSGGFFAKKNLIILGILGLVGIVNGLAEGPALHWGIWYYNDPKTLGVSFFDVYLETYIYCFLIPITIGSAAIKFANRQDRKLNHVQ
jgi:hypothetical protein